MTTIAELNKLASVDCLIELWGDNAHTVIDAIHATNAPTMTGDDFLNHCTTCGGDWGAMFLTGIKALYPTVYDAIPDDMGKHSFYAICTVLELLNIKFKE